MNYKKMIPFINAENEASHSVVELAERYALDGADELYVFMFSANEKEREEFYSLLRQIAKRIDIPFQAGLRVGRLEDAKKAFYTGADRIVLRSGQMPDKDVLDEVVGRFGVERVWMELDEKEFVGEEGFPVANLLLKHVNVGDELVGWLKAANAAVWIRDGLIRNDLEELLGLPGVNGVVTNYFEGKDIRKAKRSLREKGVPVFTLQSLVDFDAMKKGEDGLVSVVVQDYRTDEVLMLAYMNEESFARTLEDGRMTYYSRSRKELWRKGDTSGHFQYVKGMYVDCDRDAILAKVAQVGVACHTGERTCFHTELVRTEYKEASLGAILEKVYDVIRDRKRHPKEGSYTNYLFDKGIDKILKKCGEEATEMVIAAKNPNLDELRYEVADVLYHMMVLMVECGLSLEDVMGELANR